MQVVPCIWNPPLASVGHRRKWFGPFLFHGDSQGPVGQAWSPAHAMLRSNQGGEAVYNLLFCSLILCIMLQL